MSIGPFAEWRSFSVTLPRTHFAIPERPCVATATSVAGSDASRARIRSIGPARTT
jgi:hypothetical protein